MFLTHEETLNRTGLLIILVRLGYPTMHFRLDAIFIFYSVEEYKVNLNLSLAVRGFGVLRSLPYIKINL